MIQKISKSWNTIANNNNKNVSIGPHRFICLNAELKESSAVSAQHIIQDATHVFPLPEARNNDLILIRCSVRNRWKGTGFSDMLEQGRGFHIHHPEELSTTPSTVWSLSTRTKAPTTWPAPVGRGARASGWHRASSSTLPMWQQQSHRLKADTAMLTPVQRPWDLGGFATIRRLLKWKRSSQSQQRESTHMIRAEAYLGWVKHEVDQVVPEKCTFERTEYFFQHWLFFPFLLWLYTRFFWLYTSKCWSHTLKITDGWILLLFWVLHMQRGRQKYLKNSFKKVL